MADLSQQIEKLSEAFKAQHALLADKLTARDKELAEQRDLSAATKAAVDKATAENVKLATELAEMKAALAEEQKARQRPGWSYTGLPGSYKSLGEQFVEFLTTNGNLEAMKGLGKRQSDSLALESFNPFPAFNPGGWRKSITTGETSNFVPPEFAPGWIAPPMRRLRIRDLMQSVPISSNSSTYFECAGFFPASGAAVTLTSLTSSSTTATATKAGHGLTNGDRVTIAGAEQTEYNGTYTVRVSSSSVFTYVFAGSATTPATGTITFTKLNARGAATPTAELDAKPEVDVTFVEVTANVRTIPHWVTVSRQVLDDLPGLRAFVDGQLMYGVRFAEEQQLLYGSASGQQLQGITTHPRAQTYSWSAGTAGDQQADALRRAITRCFKADFEPDGIVMNPTDVEALDLLKDGTEAYIVGQDLTTGREPRIWRLPIVETNAVNAGTAIVGSWALGGRIRDRQQVGVRFSESHASLFTANGLAILAEERIAVEWHRPESFVVVTLDSAPA